MQLVRLLENHWLGCMASAGGGGRVTRLPGVHALVNPRNSAMFLNFLTIRDAAPGMLADTLAMGAAVLAGSGRPPALFVSPLAGDVTALTAELTRLGWRRQTRQSVLCADLPHPGADTPPTVLVREIEPPELKPWSDLLVQAYETPPAVSGTVRSGWTALMADPGQGATVRYVLALIDATPVGTGLTWRQGGVAGLYCGAVLPRFRRRGVERATVLSRLARAAADGATLATLQTEVGSVVQHLCVSHLGFRVAYEREIWCPNKEHRFQ